jgi:hypothetical protein
MSCKPSPKSQRNSEFNAFPYVHDSQIAELDTVNMRPALSGWCARLQHTCTAFDNVNSGRSFRPMQSPHSQFYMVDNNVVI